jgi:transketolase
LTAATTGVAATTGSADGVTVDALAVDTIRFLAADMVQSAESGHPGMPMGAAPMAWALWSRHLRHDPQDSSWWDRDRFVLSAGHGSALLYALLHLFGYDVSLTDLRAFRQLGSRTPGHPEVGQTDGVETTTGPLGQGLAMAIGMALAERMQAARFPELVDHHTYAVVGDGCLMEGVSHEAASLAGHLGLARLIVLWDDNGITIDGSVGRACSDDQRARFEAYGWQTLVVEDGADVDAVDAAITAAKTDPRPSFITVRTVIGAGAPGVEGTPQAHGSPLGADVLARAKELSGWDPGQSFHIPHVVRERCSELAAEGTRSRATWQQSYDRFRSDDPAGAAELARTQRRLLPSGLEEALTRVPRVDQASRQTSQAVLRSVASVMPELVGGSADLAGSTGTSIGTSVVTREDYSGSSIAFGIREFAMAAVANGISLHGGFRIYCSTFLVFSDYLRPALRLSALMRQPVIYILTHDSPAVGEDGPTHQPVEHVESLRLIPGVRVLRPADADETVTAWRDALTRTDGPTALILSRQSLAALTSARTDGPLATLGPVDVEIVATGSEVALALAVAENLARRGRQARVVSVPDRAAYSRQTIVPTVSLEAGVTSGWRGLVDLPIGIDTFGASGPGDLVLRQLGLDADVVADRISTFLEGA